MKQQQIGKRQE